MNRPSEASAFIGHNTFTTGKSFIDENISEVAICPDGTTPGIELFNMLDDVASNFATVKKSTPSSASTIQQGQYRHKGILQPMENLLHIPMKLGKGLQGIKSTNEPSSPNMIRMSGLDASKLPRSGIKFDKQVNNSIEHCLSNTASANSLSSPATEAFKSSSKTTNLKNDKLIEYNSSMDVDTPSNKHAIKHQSNIHFIHCQMNAFPEYILSSFPKKVQSSTNLLGTVSQQQYHCTTTTTPTPVSQLLPHWQ
jgi:hypothetical protein